MSAPVKITLEEEILNRFGKIKLICLLLGYLFPLSCMFYDLRAYEVIAVFGLCSSIFLLLLHFARQWRSNHQTVDIFKYEAHFHALAATITLIIIVLTSIVTYYFYRRYQVALLLSFLTFAVFAVEAHLSYRKQQSVPPSDTNVNASEKEIQFA